MTNPQDPEGADDVCAFEIEQVNKLSAKMTNVALNSISFGYGFFIGEFLSNGL